MFDQDDHLHDDEDKLHDAPLADDSLLADEDDDPLNISDEEDELPVGMHIEEEDEML